MMFTQGAPMTLDGNSATAEQVRDNEFNGERVQPIVRKRDIFQDVENLRRDLAVQSATQAGALATQAAAQAGALATASAAEAGADATLAATQAGAMATQTAMQAGQAAATSAALLGIGSTLIGTISALVVGMIFGAYFLRAK